MSAYDPIADVGRTLYQCCMKPFTETELLENSAAYLAELTASGRLSDSAPRVCHHFFPLDGATPDAYLPALPELVVRISPSSLVDVIGDPVGLEVWDAMRPDASWLDQRIRAFHDAATSCSAVYGGWTYEPARQTNGS